MKEIAYSKDAISCRKKVPCYLRLLATVARHILTAEKPDVLVQPFMEEIAYEELCHRLLKASKKLGAIAFQN